MRTAHPATIFVPSVASPAKLEQIRGYGARLEIAGERYADSLAASETLGRDVGRAPIHAYDQFETLQGQATSGSNSRSRRPTSMRSWSRSAGAASSAASRRGTRDASRSSAWSRKRAHAHARARAGRPVMRRRAASPPIRSRPSAWASSCSRSRSAT
jgi:hypothetical protein